MLLLDLPLSRGTAVAILALSGKTPWFKEKFIASRKVLLELRYLVLSAFEGLYLRQQIFWH